MATTTTVNVQALKADAASYESALTMLRESGGSDLGAWAVLADRCEERGECELAAEIRAKVLHAERPIDERGQLCRGEDGWEWSEFMGHRIGRGERQRDGRTFAVVYVERRTPKGRLPAKVVAHYRFTTADARERWVEDWKGTQQRHAAARLWRTVGKRLARLDFVNPWKAGDLFHTSWGYDQTNVEWFQCVGAGPRSVVLRPIAGNYDRRHHDGGTTTPRPGEFTGEAFRVTVQVRGDGSPYLPARHGSYYPWDGKPERWSDGH